jgi:hypothetical protein
MNQEYFKKEFAYMFQVDQQEPVSLFGIEAADGWNHLLFNLFTIITLIDTDKHVRVHQVKSKLAGLRFYFGWVGPERKKTLHDLYVDIVRVLPWPIRKFLNNPSKKWDPTHEQIYDLVSLFEELSYKVCETCGEPGSLRNNGHWLYTLCDKCWNEQETIKALAEIARNEKLLGSGHLQSEDV